MHFEIVGEVTGAETFARGSGIRMTDHIFVICTENAGYEASLETRKLYEVLPDRGADAHEQLRVIDESGEDYLYPKTFFAEVNLPRETVHQIFHVV